MHLGKAVEMAERRLRDALHVAVLNAARRLRDADLAERVMAAEGALIVAEADEQLGIMRAQLREITTRPWHNEFGSWFSAETGRAIAPPASVAL